MSLPPVIGASIVGGSSEGVECVVLFVAPVGELPGVVVAAVVIGIGAPVFWVWVVEGIEDVLNAIDKGFFWGIVPEV